MASDLNPKQASAKQAAEQLERKCAAHESARRAVLLELQNVKHSAVQQSDSEAHQRASLEALLEAERSRCTAAEEETVHLGRQLNEANERVLSHEVDVERLEMKVRLARGLHISGDLHEC